MILVFKAVLLPLSVFLAGCAQSPVLQPAGESRSLVEQDESVREEVVIERDASRAAIDPQLEQLLYEADEALARNRLTTPSYDNAYDRYQKVLELDSENHRARIGIKKIGRRYLSLSQLAYKKGDREKALFYVRIAARVDPNYPAISHMQTYLEQKKDEPEHANVLYFAIKDLHSRSVKLREQLAEMARRARDHQSRVLIVVPADSQGRWVYQQMRNAVEGYRLRGNIEIGDVAKVVLLDVAP